MLTSDGWTIEFIAGFFHILGVDLLNMIEETRVSGVVTGSLNATLLTLIPKVDKPMVYLDYRPISLSNLVYKIVAKIISNRIKSMLSRFISME